MYAELRRTNAQVDMPFRFARHDRDVNLVLAQCLLDVANIWNLELVGEFLISLMHVVGHTGLVGDTNQFEPWMSRHAASHIVVLDDAYGRAAIFLFRSH